MRAEILFLLVILTANLSTSWCEIIPLTFELANIVIKLQQVIADQFLECLCREPSTDCILYGERLDDMKIYRILSVRMSGAVEEGPAHVRNCMFVFGKADLFITCNKVTAQIYMSNSHMRKRCQTLKHTQGGQCAHRTGIVFNLLHFTIRKNDSVFETLSCRKAFGRLALSSTFSSTETLNQVIVATSFTLVILMLLMFLGIQYLKPPHQYPVGAGL